MQVMFLEPREGNYCTGCVLVDTECCVSARDLFDNGCDGGVFQIKEIQIEDDKS